MKFSLFPRSHSTSDHHIVQVLYYILGGIYISKNYSKLVKYLWFFCSFIILFFVNVIATGGYLLTAQKIDFVSLNFLIIPVDTSFYALVVLPLMSYYHKDKYETFKKYFKEQSKASYYNQVKILQSDLYLKKINIDVGIFWLKVECVIILTILFITPAGIIFGSNQESPFRTLPYHLIGLPYLDYIPSAHVYFVIYGIECVIVGILLIISFSQIALFMILCDMAFPEMQEVSKIFEEGLIVSIRQHQELIEMMKLINTAVDIIITTLLIAVASGLFSSVYIIFTTNIGYVAKVRQVSNATIIAVFFFAHCQFGHMFNEMNNGMIQQVYNLPWYSVPPKQRKLVHLFLCQLQRPIVFKAFKVYTVNRTTFPQIMRGIYSCATLLRRTVISF